MAEDWLCRIGWHRWMTFQTYLRGVSLYEDQCCKRCPAKQTLWDRQVVTRRQP